jgi:hypothetical protein
MTSEDRLKEKGTVYPYSLGRHLFLNGASGELLITTPPEQWAYSVEFPLDRSQLPLLNAEVTLEVAAQRGSVGVGILKEDGSRFLHEVQISEKDGPSVVQVPIKPEAGSLIIPNTSAEGPSEARVKILGVFSLFGRLKKAIRA